MLEKAYCPSPFGWFEIQGSELGVRSIRLTELKKAPQQAIPAILKTSTLG